MVILQQNGSAKFRVYLPEASKVDLVGDFTKWSGAKLSMRREAGQLWNGWWEVNAPISDGDHAFCYVVNDEWWLPDHAAHGLARDHAGHWTSLLFVPPGPPTSSRTGTRRSGRSRRVA